MPRQMSEYEKMVAGDLYDPNDRELVWMRRATRVLLDELNASVHDVKTGDRLKICKQLFGKSGKGLWLQPPFYCDYGKNIELGDQVYFNFNCVILDVARVTIGSSVMFGPNVQIYTAAHPIDWRKRDEGQEYGRPITIGDHVWIGGGVILCPGVSIGAKSVIGAGSVVTRDVPPSVVTAGNPARVIKKLPA